VDDDLPERTQLLVVGGGPGGYAAAFRAADLGLEVTLVGDEARLGGECLLRGCIPSKALLETTDQLLRARELADRGIELPDPDIDLEQLRGWKDRIVEQLVTGLEGLADQRGVRFVQARASFVSDDEVRLEDGDGDERSLGFDHAIVATGSQPLPLPGTSFGDRIIDAAAALDLADVPERLLVVGGGYVGLEMGMVYAALGSAVTVVEMTDALLPGTDPDLVEPLADHLDDRFESVHLRTSVEELEDRDGEVRVSFGGDDEADPPERYDRVLVAIGRRPNSQDLGLEDLGVEVDDDGAVQVDEACRTSQRRIHAVGDVVGGAQLAHEAFHEGIVAAEAIAGEPAAFDMRAVPAVIYTDPQIAWCGLTEQEADDRDLDVEIHRFPWRASGRALTLEGDAGLTKLLCEPGTDRVLGVGIVGRHAESLIGEAVLAVEMGAVAEDLARSIAPHPTLSEPLHEAAQLVLGGATHLPPRR
jgi:dihydrolipoamide dehydrogenase